VETTGSAQLVIFICGAVGDFNLIEEVAAIQNMKGVTTGLGFVEEL
jgi:hypothetical protein